MTTASYAVGTRGCDPLVFGTNSQRQDACEKTGADDNKPLRILMLTPRFLPDMGGIETHVQEVTKRLAADGHSVAVLTTDRSGTLLSNEVVAGVRIRRVKAWPRRRDYYFAPEIWGAIKNAECDIIHVQGYHTFVAPLGMLAAVRNGIPFVITFHSGGHSSPLRNLLRGAQWAALRGLVRRAAHWIAVSRFEAELFSEKMRLPRDRVSVVPNGAQLAWPNRPAAAGGERPLIVSIGRLEHYKGHHRAIEAMPELLRRVPDAKLRILGEGPYKPELLALVERLQLAGCVEVGGIPPSERDRLAAILGSASLVVLLSAYEAHPVAVLEALALGRRVLVTNCSGFIEMAKDGVVETVAPDANSAQIADAMAATLADDRARPPVVLPNWEDCAGQLERIYRRVLSS